MTREDFLQLKEKYADTIEQIRKAAHQLHESVNQHYDGIHPYGFHLDMVAHGVMTYGHEACANEHDFLPLIFGAFYHDSIEDARQTYNDVKKKALEFMDESQAFMAAELVYALTNDKGRTRAERAGERYYAGIRQTPYAPLVKLADRLANISYSCRGQNADNDRMKAIYRQEWPHFIASISTDNPQQPFLLPKEMIAAVEQLVTD